MAKKEAGFKAVEKKSNADKGVKMPKGGKKGGKKC
jgi:hypothetical protein